MIELIKIIAPWLPIFAVAYILVANRSILFAFCRIAKKKIMPRSAQAARKLPAAPEGLAPAPAGLEKTCRCQRLLSFPALLIFSICMGNKGVEFDDEKNRVRFDNRLINDKASKLFKNCGKKIK